MADDKELKRIADHLEVLNDEMGSVQVSIAGIQVDVKWLKASIRWLMSLVAAILMGGIGYAIFNAS